MKLTNFEEAVRVAQGRSYSAGPFLRVCVTGQRCAR
jgi:hypothetical protein